MSLFLITFTKINKNTVKTKCCDVEKLSNSYDKISFNFEANDIFRAAFKAKKYIKDFKLKNYNITNIQDLRYIF